jgi:hypothetical protein
MKYNTYWFIVRGVEKVLEVVAVNGDAAKADIHEAYWNAHIVTWGQK